jgi:primary-amine oxidase
MSYVRLIFTKDKLHEAVVNLSLGKVASNVRLGPCVHSNADADEIINVERIALEDEGVKAEIAKLQLPEGTVIISDPWIYGSPYFSRSHFVSADESQVLTA